MRRVHRAAVGVRVMSDRHRYVWVDAHGVVWEDCPGDRRAEKALGFVKHVAIPANDDVLTETVYAPCECTDGNHTQIVGDPVLSKDAVLWRIHQNPWWHLVTAQRTEILTKWETA
jgi:hypothetical protein